MRKNNIFLILILLFSSCQSAWEIKPEKFPQNLSELANLYESHKGLVVIFWQSTCPCVKRYEARIKKLHEKYGPEGLNFVYMSSNANESFAKAQAEYAKRNMPLKLLRDEGGQFARSVNARGTPAALLIDNNGKLLYMGWIDNERREGEAGRKAYLEDAIKEHLAKLPVSVKTSPMFGCPIR